MAKAICCPLVGVAIEGDAHQGSARTDHPEVFLDQGEVDMLGVMEELVRQKYSRTLYPEHPPQMDVDLENPDESISSGMFTGFAYTVGYARATMQAALANQSN